MFSLAVEGWGIVGLETQFTPPLTNSVGQSNFREKKEIPIRPDTEVSKIRFFLQRDSLKGVGLTTFGTVRGNWESRRMWKVSSGL